MGANFGFLLTDLAQLPEAQVLDVVEREARNAGATSTKCLIASDLDVAPLFQSALDRRLSYIYVDAQPTIAMDGLAETIAREIGCRALSLFVSDLFCTAGFQLYYWAGPERVVSSTLLVDGHAKLGARRISYRDVAAIGVAALVGRELVSSEELFLTEKLSGCVAHARAYQLVPDREACDHGDLNGRWQGLSMTWPGYWRGVLARLHAKAQA